MKKLYTSPITSTSKQIGKLVLELEKVRKEFDEKCDALNDELDAIQYNDEPETDEDYMFNAFMELYEEDTAKEMIYHDEAIWLIDAVLARLEHAQMSIIEGKKDIDIDPEAERRLTIFCNHFREDSLVPWVLESFTLRSLTKMHMF